MSPSAQSRRLIGVVKSFRGCRVAVLADLVADQFLYGDIARVSREAPVLVLDHRRSDWVPGGGGNSVANLRALGAVPVPVGIVGKDEAGEKLVQLFRDSGIPVGRIRAVPGYRTPSKSRVIAGGVHTRRQQIVRIDRGAERGDLPSRTASSLTATLQSALRRCRGLLVADYSYGAATPRALRAVFGNRRPTLPVTVDSRARIASFRKLTACTPNQEEVEEAVGHSLSTRSSLERAGRKLLSRTGNSAVVVTRGAAGMSLFQSGRKTLHIPAYGSDEVADVTGAGDTVIASLTLAVVAGAGLADAARLANYAAGLVVAKAGTATVGPEELMAAIEEDSAE